MEVIGTFEPAVTPEDFRRARHRAPDTDEAYADVLASAEDVVTVATGRPVTERTIAFEVPVTGWRRWWVPVLPVNDIVSIELRDDAGEWVVQDQSDVRLIQAHSEPQVLFPESWGGFNSDHDTVRITLRVGAGERPIRGLRQAIILLAAEFYDAQIAVDEVVTTKISFGVRQLIRQSRYRRPCEFAED